MKIEENIPLKDYSTFRIGGPAKYFCNCEKMEELKEALNWAQEKKQRVFILGGGSNILFSDKGFDGLVVRIMNHELRLMNNHKTLSNLSSKKMETEGVKIVCGAGVSLAKLVNFARKNGLSGLEWAAGIPGTAGGAVRGNAGAFGEEMADSVEKIKILRTEVDNLEITELSKTECRFGYRDSVLKQERDFIIWEIKLELAKGNESEIGKKMQAILTKRKSKQPSKYPSAGSVFKNPKVSPELAEKFEQDTGLECKNDRVPAGWLIESCGLKGKKIGGAKISEKQANFIINLGEASTEDVIILMSLVKQKVRNQFGVQLQEEIEIVL